MRTSPSILVHEVCPDVGNCEEERVLQAASERTILEREVSAWVGNLAAWTVIEHLTFQWESSVASATRIFEKFHKRVLPGVPYFYAVERNPNRLGNHLHALLAAPPSVYRKRVWQMWHDSYGRARIEPIRSNRQVSDYCTKYVTKDVYQRDGWWNFDLPEQGVLREI